MSVAIIGAGIGGLGTACLLAQAGYNVTVFEKNNRPGGRAGRLSVNGFKFDTGPSWYLMPDVFEQFFHELGEDVSDHLELVRLQPGYRVFMQASNERIDVMSNLAHDRQTFESYEDGAGQRLEHYLQQSADLYKAATGDFLYQNYNSLADFLKPALLRSVGKLNALSNMHRQAGRYFTDSRLRQIIEYPSIFLGTHPKRAPALYSLLNHVLFTQGVYYPRGGMFTLVEALERIAWKHGAVIHLNAPVEKIIVQNKQVGGVITRGREYAADIVISNAGLYHTETALLGNPFREHSEAFWHSQAWAPSALLMYLGIDRQYPSLAHHNLLFSKQWEENLADIFERTVWPQHPSIYVCAPSKTDPGVAPKNYENLFVLVPVAAGLTYTPSQLEAYAGKVLGILEKDMDLPDLKRHIIYRKLFSVKDFTRQFNSFRGTGLGLAHTLRQSAAWRPNNQSKKVKNLYYVGADVHPGIGLPATLISAQLVAQRLLTSSG